MRRRELIFAIGCALLRPFAASGQQPRSRVVGFLGFGSVEAAKFTFAPAQRQLADMGFVEGRNLIVEYRCADNQEGRLLDLANELVQLQVDAIAVYSGQAVAAAKAATTSIPIIFFTGFDPVASGFVASLSRPSGNVTGISALNVEVLAKRLEMLRELLPGARSIALLYAPTNLVAGGERVPRELELAANALSVKLLPAEVSQPEDFEAAFAKLAGAQADGVLVSADAVMFANREALVGVASRYRIPAAYPTREFAALGGLVSYGTNYAEASRQVGEYIGRVLNGERPDDLPVRQVTNLHLVINMQTAKTLGLAIPVPLLARADEVIE